MKYFFIFLFALILVVGSWTGYIYWRDKRFPNQEDIEWFSWRFGLENKLSNVEVPTNLPENVSVEYFAQNASQAAQKAASLMEASIRTSQDPDKPITQQALDYARYQYCKQVIIEYESKF